MIGESIDVCNLIFVRSITIIAAIILDLLIGDPHWMPHIVRAFGKNIERIVKSLKQIFPVRDGKDEDANLKTMIGQATVIRMLVGNIVIFGLIFLVLDKYLPVAGIIARIFVIYQCISARQLQKEAMFVLEELNKGGVSFGRKALANIVGRDTKNLDYDAIVRATVETVAENTSDGVIAPLFYIFIFGALGGVVYKVVNTMDSMIGYHSDEYEYIGRAAAKMDDFFNFLPSRIAAHLMICSCAVCGYDYKQARKIFKRDRYNSTSPNSGQTESVVAGALGVRLLGPAMYNGVLVDKPYIGDDSRNIAAEDVKKTIKLMYYAKTFLCVIGFVIIGLLGFIVCAF